MIKRLLFYLAILFSGYANASIQEAFIPSDDATLFCRMIGKGKPLIVLHGGPGLTQDYLLPQLYALAENNFVIFYDQRGCGQSTGEIKPETINLETFVNDLETIRKAFHFEKIAILGHSWGGFLAMHYAIAHPESIDKLILSNSMPGSSEGLALFASEWLRRMSPYLEEYYSIQNAPGFDEGDPDLIERLHRLLFRTYCYDPEKADLLNVRMTSTAAVNKAKVFTLFREHVFEMPFDVHASLQNLKMPTLIIHGEADPIPPATAQRLHESIQGSKFILIKKCGHFPHVEKPETYFNSLMEFLQ